MLGEIEFKIRDVLGCTRGDHGLEISLGGKDTVLAGDPKQCAPVATSHFSRRGITKGKV